MGIVSACACLGPQPGQTECPCALRRQGKPSINVGTLGHIDHGKSVLMHALTQMPDALEILTAAPEAMPWQPSIRMPKTKKRPKVPGRV